MKRTFYRRGKKVVVEQIEDLLAIKMSVDAEGRSRGAVDALGAPATSSAMRARNVDMSPDEAAAFARANWLFLEADASRAQSEGLRSGVDGIDTCGKFICSEDGRGAIVTDEVFVKFRKSVSREKVEELLALNNCTLIEELGFSPNAFLVKSLDQQDGIDKANALRELDQVKAAEPSVVEFMPGRSRPTDPAYPQQWQWRNTGQLGGVQGADVAAEAAWQETLGAGVRVAVIDNGFNADHPDLAEGVGKGSGLFGTDGNFIADAGRIPLGDHGTFCAGQIGARWNNGEAGCGIAPECELMLIATLRDQVGTQATLAKAVAYAADPALYGQPGDGAQILSCSLGPNGANWPLTMVLEEAIEFAAARGRNARGLPIFWATTNGNFEIRFDEVVSHRDVIAVGRSTRRDLENNSGFGPELEFLAPGVDVVNISNFGFGPNTGTSFAAPIAAGIGALALSINPSLTAKELRKLMQDSCDQVGPIAYPDGRNDDYGHGRVNAARAVQLARNSLPKLVKRRQLSFA